MAWLLVKDAARKLGKSSRTIQRQAKQGKLTARVVDNPGGGHPALEVWVEVSVRSDKIEQPQKNEATKRSDIGTTAKRQNTSEATKRHKLPTPQIKTKRHEATPAIAPKNEATKRSDKTGRQRSDTQTNLPDYTQQNNNAAPDTDWMVGLTEKQKEVALFRYEIVSEVLSAPFRGRGQVKQEIASRELYIPHSRRTRVSVAAIQSWITLYNQGKIRALIPAGHRSDRGTSKRLPLHVQEIIKAVYLEGLNRPDKLRRSARQIIDRVETELAELGEEQYILYLNERVIQRLIAPLKPVEQGAPTKRIVRFEASEPNELWQADFSHSELHIKRSGNRYGIPRLFTFMDDHSRALYGFYMFGESQTESDRCLRGALLGAEAGVCPELVPFASNIPLRGKPSKLLVDNGKVYISRRMKMTLADMEIKLIKAAPYHAQTKGKQERIYREVHKFERDLMRWHKVRKMRGGEEIEVDEQLPYLTLTELNTLWAMWLAAYHTRVHTYDSIRGKEQVVPLERWNNISEVVEVEPLMLSRALMTEVVRTIGRDWKISLNGRKYEVPSMYFHRKITVRYDPAVPGEVWYHDISTGAPLGAGYECNRLDNLSREALAEVDAKNEERELLTQPAKPPIELKTSFADALAKGATEAALVGNLSEPPKKLEKYQFKRAAFDTESIAPLDAVNMMERKLNRQLDHDEAETIVELCEENPVLPEVFEQQFTAAMLDKASEFHILAFVSRVLEANRRVRNEKARETEAKLKPINHRGKPKYDLSRRF